MAKKSPKCCVFIDNSNLFIEGQKTYAKRHDFLSDRDIRFRIDYWKLIKVLKRKRRCIYSALFGSEPPPIEELWERVREKRIEVFRYNRGDDNSEKELDTDLTAHVTRKAIEMTRSHQDNLTFVIVAGDGDYISAFKQVMQEKFNLEIYTWKGCISGRIKQFANLKKYRNKVAIHYLDESILENDVCYLADRWKGEINEIPPERSIVFQNLKINLDARSLTGDITKHIRLPCKYFQPDPDTVVVIVVGDVCQIVDKLTGFGDTSEIEETLLSKFGDMFDSIKKKYENEILLNEFCITNYPSYLQTLEELIPYHPYHGNTEAYDDDEAGKYILVKRQVRKSPQKYSQRCKYRFSCKRGRRCIYSHTNKEKEHFRNHPKNLGEYYKSKQCVSADTGGCTSKSCVFAHGLNEARCYICDPGGKVGVHWMANCPNKKDNQKDSLSESDQQFI